MIGCLQWMLQTLVNFVNRCLRTCHNLRMELFEIVSSVLKLQSQNYEIFWLVFFLILFIIICCHSSSTIYRSICYHCVCLRIKLKVSMNACLSKYCGQCFSPLSVNNLCKPILQPSYQAFPHSSNWSLKIAYTSRNVSDQNWMVGMASQVSPSSISVCIALFICVPNSLAANSHNSLLCQSEAVSSFAES